LLVERQWPEALALFREAFHSPEPAVRIAALAGLAASRFRLDVTPVARILRRRKLASQSGL